MPNERATETEISCTRDRQVDRATDMSTKSTDLTDPPDRTTLMHNFGPLCPIRVLTTPFDSVSKMLSWRCNFVFRDSDFGSDPTIRLGWPNGGFAHCHSDTKTIFGSYVRWRPRVVSNESFRDLRDFGVVMCRLGRVVSEVDLANFPQNATSLSLRSECDKWPSSGNVLRGVTSKSRF